MRTEFLRGRLLEDVHLKVLEGGWWINDGNNLILWEWFMSGRRLEPSEALTLGGLICLFPLPHPQT
jgi:hypothetical protein